MKSNWIRKIIGGLSFASALFVFQACYGTPQDFGLDFLIEGQVKSKNSGLPIKGIKVSVADNMQYELTDENGQFSFYTEMMDNMKILFEDIDSTQNGLYANKDTVLARIADRIFLDINLEEK
jgi:putative lipoprotein (rSAM/lipoprotein system)